MQQLSEAPDVVGKGWLEMTGFLLMADLPVSTFSISPEQTVRTGTQGRV